MARKPIMSIAEVEMEIERLNNSPFVKMAKEAERKEKLKRQHLYNLRVLEKKGKELYEAGKTLN